MKKNNTIEFLKEYYSGDIIAQACAYCDGLSSDKYDEGDIIYTYVKYEDIDVYYDEENKIEFERGWIHSERIYPFLCFTVQGLKKKN